MASTASRRGAIIEGINVTPLVDITLVLLIIFIVTAKLVVTAAVPLDLPKATQSEELQTILSVVVPAEGPILVDGVTIGDAALAHKARAALAADPELRAVIQADRAVPHGRVMDVLDTLKSAGLVRVAFGAVRPETGAQPVGAVRSEGGARPEGASSDRAR
ncbi:MAG TPA: biopolymer transporter ExbD [Polyangiaceae bacterium]|nr:biopolymer transporter ExbD [Polyangiaceae bacterium]